MVLKSKRAAAASSSASSSPAIVATSKQSRFHAATLNTSREVDLEDVSISIGQRDLLSGAHLRLKEGVRYGLTGRNGSGKSTLFEAIDKKLIPGFPTNLRVLLLSQVEDSARAAAAATEGNLSVLEHVVRGDKERMKAVHEYEALTQAVESTSILETQTIVYRIKLEKKKVELQEAQTIASRRSGTRGKEAREEEIKAEERLKVAEELLANVETEDINPEVVQEALEMLQDVQANLETLETATAEARAAVILTGLGFTQEMMDGPYSALSGGWRSRTSLATSLLVQSDILLLDEVSNFLDLEAIIWLEHFLTLEPRTLVLISHDQDFLSNVVEETIILRNKTLKYFEGTPAAFEVNEKKERRRLEGAKEALDKKKEHIEKSIQQGIASAKKTGDENRQRMVKSRQKKLDERFGVEQSAKGTRFKLNRDLAGYHLTNRAELATEDREARVKISIPSPEPLRTLGDLIHFDAVEYRFPKAKTPLLSDVTFTVEQGGRVAFIGANGNGKSTLAKLIVGEIAPSKGKIVRHPALKIGYFSQHSVEDLSLPIESLSINHDGPITALAYFLNYFESKGERVAEQDVRSCLGSFGLQGKIASETPLSQLSGGQKVRLAFALIIFRPPPLLLLDEITTHVDHATIKALALALRTFTGAIVLITHDRWFSRVVIEGDSLRSVDDDDDEEASDSDEDEDDVLKVKGKTWRVGAGKIKLMEKGMQGYVGIVERKLERRRREAEAAGRS